MADRYYDRDFYRIADLYEETVNAYGLVRPGYELTFAAGSKTYGNAYTVYEVARRELWGADDGRGSTYGSGHYEPTIGGHFLGMTAREACEALQHRRRVIFDMAQTCNLPRVADR